MNIKFEKVHEDKRGSINRFLFSEKEFLIIFTKKGHSRGGDYHKSKQHDIVLCGTAEFRWKLGGGEQTRILNANDKIQFETDVPHMWTAKENLLILEWLEGKFEKTYYQPYRRIVES